MNPIEIKSLERIIEYLADEKGDYESRGKPQGHIYADIEIIENWLRRNPACSGLRNKSQKRNKKK